ncbi:MAG: hypothetical protein HGA90_07630 [Alphaproteobacteria bacterium]|nr:hypothetical protein [Alphaproteobacteria bacterium]
MDTTTKRAYAKLNLTLGVLYKRADGYHALDSIMQTIDLFDTVTVERARDIMVTSTGMVLPYDNTTVRVQVIAVEPTTHLGPSTSTGTSPWPEARTTARGRHNSPARPAMVTAASAVMPSARPSGTSRSEM